MISIRVFVLLCALRCAAYAVDLFAYYQCFKCKKAYFGGDLNSILVAGSRC